MSYAETATPCAICGELAIAVAPPDGQPSCPPCDARCYGHLTRDEQIELFRNAAGVCAERGWLTQPLALDANDKPKKAITPGWSSLQLSSATLDAMRWDHAAGIGLILGPVSGNVAVLDVDDVEMSDAVYDLIMSGGIRTRMVRTISDRLHVYLHESQPSPGTKPYSVTWQGRTVSGELRAKGGQVSIPPTPGYRLLTGDAEPIRVPNILAMWLNICAKLGAEPANGKLGGAGYPAPWQPTVVKGDRNKSVFVEACRLRDARMPVEQALDVMRWRYDNAFTGDGIGWSECERTVKSAYSHEVLAGQAVYERWAV